MATITIAVLASLLVGIGGFLLGSWANRQAGIREKEARERAVQTGNILQSLQGLEHLPTLIAGLEAMCKEHARTTDVLAQAVAIIQKSFDASGQAISPEDAEREQDEEAQAEMRRLVNRGIAPHEAEARVRERRMYEELGRSR